MPGEFDLIEWIKSQHAPSEFVPVPQGDDLAVLKWNAADLLLVGIDQALDGIHFDSAIHSPRHIGAKAMNRNLSDCAAMACLPAAAVVSVALPNGAGIDYAKELYLGLREAADAFDCTLVGGDTGSWAGKLAVTVSILGKSAGTQPITRSGAKPGDGIYVTGRLGGSILGRHMNFVPRITLARELAGAGGITAMLDISDGLSRDLRQICDQSHVGAIIDADAVPIHLDAIELSRRDGQSPLDHALHDGEDHELLFTVARTPTIQGMIRVGTIVCEPGVWIQRADRRAELAPKGWQHTL
ncbi:MAG TPA: thiamine-phosphate kinase [Tepidisphaeraceae bacterium]|nr:thiamine-phosphate kinase [Tepidisphaeraceae bacterium]